MYLAGHSVISTQDGTRGYVLNGYASDGNQWTEYEVVTEYGVEIWSASAMLVIA